jgi:hypothetical protein
VLERYESVFQLERYRRCRTWYIASVLQSRDPLLAEIREQFEELRFAVPVTSRILSRLAPRVFFKALLRAYVTSYARRDAERFDLPVRAEVQHSGAPTLASYTAQ